MNERILELAEQALIPYKDENQFVCYYFSKQKFAELIVEECANWINENVGMIDEDARADLYKHFGVEK